MKNFLYGCLFIGLALPLIDYLTTLLSLHSELLRSAASVKISQNNELITSMESPDQALPQIGFRIDSEGENYDDED